MKPAAGHNGAGVRAVAFDFDGVLVESVDVKSRAYAALFQHESRGAIDRILHYHLENGGVSRFEKFRYIYREILRRPLSEEEFEDLCRRFSDLVVEKVVASPWVAGAEAFLKKNHGRFKFFIVSGTPEAELRDIVIRRGMARWFDEVLGSPRKKDELLKWLLGEYGLDRNEMVYVGDAKTDHDAAVKCGIPFIWRRSPEAAQILEHFEGTCIPDLEGLERCLKGMPI